MQIRSFRGSGEPAWVNAYSNACFRLGPDPRRALGPAATSAASTGRTRDRTRPMLQQRKKALARAPSTRDPRRTLGRNLIGLIYCDKGAWVFAERGDLDIHVRPHATAVRPAWGTLVPVDVIRAGQVPSDRTVKPSGGSRARA